MRDIASYIKNIYARYALLTAHISLYSMRASLTRIIYERILGWVIEDAYNYYLTLFIYKLRNYLLFLKLLQLYIFLKFFKSF
jgi:hypothetical protein